MNKKELKDRIRKNWYSYHSPGCSNLYRRKINAIFFNPANSLEHELAKAKVCYEIQKSGGKFLTEAVRNKKVDGKERRPDIVDLATGIEFEIETDPKRAARFEGEENDRNTNSF